MFYVLLEGTINNTMCKSFADLSFYLMTHIQCPDSFAYARLGTPLRFAHTTVPVGGWGLGSSSGGSARRPCGGWFGSPLGFWVRSGGCFALVWLAARSARLPPRGADFLSTAEQGFSYMHLRLLGAIYDYSKTRHFR